MYKYLVAFVLLTPFIGIILVEDGAFAASIGITGYPNGAGLAYACYAATIALVAWACSGRPPRTTRPQNFSTKHFDASLKVFGTNLFWLNSAFLLIFLFGFGAINVLVGSIGKGEFRANLGTLGSIPNLMTKFVLPALLAYAAALYQKSSKCKRLRWLMAGNFVLLFTIGASWGFKTTAAAVLLPCLMIIFWRLTFASLVGLVLAFAATIVIFYYLFDADVETYVDIQTFLFTRITVIQGDVAWFVWDKYISNEELPKYLPTLMAVFGGKVLNMFGLSRTDFYEWIQFHYDLLITYVAGSPLDQIQDGHSITATPFAEGLVAGGLWGVAFFAILGGLLVGRLYAFIFRSLVLGQDGRAAIASTYFCFYVFPWLNGGAVVQLVHISVWIALLVTLLALRFMRLLGRHSERRTLTAMDMA